MDNKYLKAESDVLDSLKDFHLNIKKGIIKKSLKNMTKNKSGKYHYEEKESFSGSYYIELLNKKEIYFRIKSNWVFPINVGNQPSKPSFFIITENQDNPDLFKVVPYNTIVRCIHWAKSKNIDDINWFEKYGKKHKSLTNIKNFIYLKEFKSILLKFILTEKESIGIDLYSKFPMAIENRKKNKNDKMVYNGNKFVKYTEYINS